MGLLAVEFDPVVVLGEPRLTAAPLPHAAIRTVSETSPASVVLLRVDLRRMFDQSPQWRHLSDQLFQGNLGARSWRALSMSAEEKSRQPGVYALPGIGKEHPIQGSPTLSPKEDSLERIEVRGLVAEDGQQSVAIAVDELAPSLFAEGLLESSECRSLHPLHDISRGRKMVGVDLHSDVRLVVAQLIEQSGICLGSEHVLSNRIDRRIIYELGRDLSSNDMGRMVCVSRHLHRQLPAGLQRSRPPSEYSGVIGHPLQRGVCKHDVERCRLFPRAEVTQFEPNA